MKSKDTSKEEEFVSLFDVFSNSSGDKKRRVIKDELLEIKGDLKATMDSGLKPEEMQSAAILYIATQTAIHIVDIYN